LRLWIPTSPLRDARVWAKNFHLVRISDAPLLSGCGILPFFSEGKTGLHSAAVAPVVSSFLSETRASAVASSARIPCE
jgi:hypothetical protein